MTNPKISLETVKEIEQYLREGHSQNKTAKEFKVSDGFVNKIAKNANIHNGHSLPKKAIAARKAYAKADRLLVLHKLMGKIDDILDSPDLKAGNLRDISIALGTTIDKYRLEEAEEKDQESGIDDLMEEIKKEAGTYSS